MSGPRGPYASRRQLTERQRRVLVLMAEGRTNGEIAEALGITLDGAKWHVSAILAKLEVDSREEAVAAWREQRKPGARLRRWITAPAAPLAGLSTAMKGAVAAVVLVGVGVTLGAFWWSGGTPEQTEGPPEEPGELLERMAEELSEDDQVLHVETEMIAQESRGPAQHLASFEAWFDFDDERGRVEFEVGADNQADMAESWTAWFDGQDVYRMGPDDDAPRRGTVGETWKTCLDTIPFMASVMACGFSDFTGSFDASNVRLLGNTTWEGQAALGITFEHLREIPEQLSPPDTPTPTPLPATPTVAPDTVTLHTTYEFYIEPGSYIPLGFLVEYQRNGEHTGDMVYDYDAELVSEGSINADLLDPRAAGYRTNEEREMALLDRATREEAVYWLGRSADLRTAAGRVRLARVEQRNHPERPALLTLDYEADDGGRLRIEAWHEDEWREFLSSLDEAGESIGNFVYASDCWETTGAGHDVQPAANAPPTPEGGYRRTPRGAGPMDDSRRRLERRTNPARHGTPTWPRCTSTTMS